MFFYTKRIFKLTALNYVLPGKIDQDFYEKTKAQLVEDENFNFKSDVDYWNLYKYIFIVFLTFLGCAIILSALLVLKTNITLLYGLLILTLIITFQPTVYFIILMVCCLQICQRRQLSNLNEF
jgi:hypothetical protein